MRKEDFSKIEIKNNICINVFCYENKLIFPIYISGQKFENLKDLLLVINEKKSHYVYIEDFDRFMFHKTKNENKNYFCKSCLQCFSSKNVLMEHKEVFKSVRFEKGTIEFKNYSKQIPVPFKVYADFECILDSVESYEGSWTKKYHDLIPCSFAYKLVMRKHFNENLIMTEEEEQFQSSNMCWICKKLIDDEEVRDDCHITGKFRGQLIGVVT